MRESRITIKGYFGLKALSFLFKVIAIVCLVIALITLGAAVAALVTDPGSGIGAASTQTTTGTIGAIVITFDTTSGGRLALQALPFVFWSLVAYATSQVIDITMSINDNLRRLARPGESTVKELQQAAHDMTGQTKKITALLEQHHRRLTHLESRE